MKRIEKMLLSIQCVIPDRPLIVLKKIITECDTAKPETWKQIINDKCLKNIRHSREERNLIRIQIVVTFLIITPFRKTFYFCQRYLSRKVVIPNYWMTTFNPYPVLEPKVISILSCQPECPNDIFYWLTNFKFSSCK